MYSSGARRYLLRHETADFAHYAKLHPSSMSLENRMKCLSALKKIGFQTGDGFMTGAPFQTAHHIVKDIRFMQALSPDMIGIGPFIHHRATPFAHCPYAKAHCNFAPYVPKSAYSVYHRACNALPGRTDFRTKSRRKRRYA